ncbi:EAL domain-containing protein [Sulfurimonas aquatica]|uniref:EAL domain-containing protein n=1 Tax=Sulfurimonas aquatica TaxID=2672570 RepID=A0A975B1C5_9BACT|nr:bifunctional diguanylate cyclase/phosphodiesterase [Sulfurimonas aquatica]QSZ42315.1 EAL domain-containing protein [Sulfurimonas aquatica]
MQKISLTLKITLSFITVIVPSIFFLYFVFYNLFYEKMLDSEKQKATLIAQTIEPMIGMNYYLGLNDEIINLREQTTKHPLVHDICITLESDKICEEPKLSDNILNVSYPVKHPVTSKKIGYINIEYKLDEFNQAFRDIQSTIINSLALLGIVFLIFGLLIQKLLAPLGEIAKRVKGYKPGENIDFSHVRTEPETKEIITAFGRMLNNIKEHNMLLERYKYAVDESALVSKTDLDGNITYVNDEFVKSSGFTRSELLGKNHNITRHPDMKDETFKQMWSLLKNKKAWKGIIKNRNKDGSEYYVKSIILPLFDENMNSVEYMSIRTDITTIIKQQEQIARQTTDLITGLPNRVKLEEDIKNLKHPKLALIALDNFNVIEDYYGYDIGNKTLKDTASMLTSYIQNSDINIYKLSSGQFGVLVGESTEVDIFSAFCKNILQKIDDYIVHVEDESFNIHATAGMTYIKENAFANASLALLHAQSTKKDSVIYEDANHIIESYENNLQWTKNIKHALKEDRIAVFVQPIFKVGAKEANKYECLVRMVGEDGKIISPFFFLDIAKKSKLYLEITKKVIEKSFAVFSQLEGKTFSINLSVEDLLNKESMEFLIEYINKFKLADQLILEIVESEGIDNFEEVISVIAELKALGCRISIDDFGTGYSNFAYLMQLNVDYIKIDGSLIKDIDHDKNSQIISKTIVDFAQQLEMKTVAEFIHNKEVMEYVQEMGVDYLQGFHLGEPEPIENLLG